MARIALIVSLLTALLALFGFFQWAWAEWKAHRTRKKLTWFLVLFCFVPGIAQATELASDKFDRANGGLGANWTTVTGSDDPQIVNEQVQAEVIGGSTGSHAMYTAVTWPDDQYGTVRVVNTDAAIRQVEVVVRGLTASRTGYECIVSGRLGSTARARIYKVTAGTSVLLQDTGSSETYAAYSVMRCSASGSNPTTIKMFIDDVEVLTHDDSSSPFTTGSVGINVYTSSGDITEAQLDEFTGGSGAGTGMGFGSDYTAGGVSGCTVTTISLAADVVNRSIHDVAEGSTVCLPSGTATWLTTAKLKTSVLISRDVALLGQTSCTGIPVTCIDGSIVNDGTGSLSGEDPITMTGTNSRVSQISFKDPRAVADAKPMLAMICHNCRVDHNSFTTTNPNAVHGTATVSSPTTTQLLDHNYFRDLNGATNVYGGVGLDGSYGGNPGDYSWATPMTLGEEFATYMEDNHYDYTVGVILDGAFDTYSGARYVFRYNTVNSTTSGGHGLDSGGLRSVLSAEVYRNTFTNLGTHISSWWNSRGGYHSVWQNTISASGGSYDTFLKLSNYRSDDTACGVCSWALCNGSYIADQNTGGQEGYACRDQVGRGPTTDYVNDWPVDLVSPTFSQPLFPAYSWGNDFKGTTPTISNVAITASGGGNVRVQTYHILNNRDFYMEAASFDGTSGTGVGTSLPGTCTTGVAYFKTDEGSWNVSGNGDGSGLLYICTATDTWTLSYTPYTYPHPLQGEDTPVTPIASAVVVGRVLRFMEILVPVLGLGFQFRRVILASCVVALAYTSSVGVSTWMIGKTVTKVTAVKTLTVINHLMKPRNS
jgi:hypothetical protein